MSEKAQLDDRQHAELLLFAEGTLQDIRETKLIQRQATIGAITLMAGILGLTENTDLSLCVRYVWCGVVVIIGVAAVSYILRKQKALLRFRDRLRQIYNNHFSLEWSDIIGDKETYMKSKRFPLWGDDVPLWLALIIGAVIIVDLWLVNAA